MNFLFFPEHFYTLGATGIKLHGQSTFSSRQEANKRMYEIIGKKKLVIKEVYDDKHFKTYVCNNGVKFYINRV